MANLLDALKKKKVLVADGAWGTEIAKIENIEKGCPELLNLSHPQIIEKIACSYIKAGAEIILTNTFGANYFKLKKYGAEDKIKEINKKGVEISRKVAGNSIVMASIGPTGELLQPYGTLLEKEVENCYKQQISILIDSGADGIVIETMSDIREAKCALDAAKSIKNIPVVVCFTFIKTQNGFKTIMGNSVDECAKFIIKHGVDVIGSNCGSGIADFVTIAKELKESSGLPVWIKPNAGIPHLVSGKTVYPDTPEYMAGYVPELIKSGTSIIGGCCGTTPLHIQKISEIVSNLLKTQ